MNYAILLISAAALNGCILYDDTARCRDGIDCEGDYFEAGLAGNEAGNDEEAPAATFSLSPDEATAGETLIATLTAENFDLSTVGDVELFGNATIVATQNRGDEVIITISVSSDAQAGDVVDLLLTVGNDAVFVEAALSVSEGAAEGGGGEDTDCE